MTADVQAWVNTPATNFGWVIKTDEAGSRTAKRFASRNNATAAERPVLTIDYTSATPVTLAFLKANEVSGGVLVNWQTQSEFNNDFFLVEHSIDGSTFASIGKVNGAGTSSTPKNYQLMHQAVLPGKHFYRLAQKDINGNVQYSQVVLVNVRTKHNVLTISPNPAVDILSVRGITINSGMVYQIVNSTGAKVASGKFINSQINISSLASGYYSLNITDGSEEFTGRFLIK